MPVRSTANGCPTAAVPVIVGAPVAAVPASVLNAVADWVHWLFPIALVAWTRTSYAVVASRFLMTVRVTGVGVSPRYQFVQSVVPSTRYSMKLRVSGEPPSPGCVHSMVSVVAVANTRVGAVGSGGTVGAPRDPSTLWPASVPFSGWLRSIPICCEAVRMRSFTSSTKVLLPLPIQMPSLSSSPACTV